MKPAFAAAVLAGALVVIGTAQAAPTPAQSCEAAKLNALSKLAQCRLKADAAYAKSGDLGKRTAAYAKCAQKLGVAYAAAEAKFPGACPTAGDLAPIASFLEACTIEARDWTDGTLAAPLVFQRFAASGQTTCWAGGSSFAQPVPADCHATGQDGEHAAGAALAYVDNGDGTITDLASGLMWEKKSDDNSLHDKDRAHRWAGVCSFDGSTFCTRDPDCEGVGGVCQTMGGGATAFQWLDQINAAAFAGHSDWRLPNVRELASLASYERQQPAVEAPLDAQCGLGSSGSPGCSVFSCSCTQPLPYWSSSSNAFDRRFAWSVDFLDGRVKAESKAIALQVRAVRGGR